MYFEVLEIRMQGPVNPIKAAAYALALLDTPGI
jgi:hypothetical protein